MVEEMRKWAEVVHIFLRDLGSRNRYAPYAIRETAEYFNDLNRTKEKIL